MTNETVYIDEGNSRAGKSAKLLSYNSFLRRRATVSGARPLGLVPYKTSGSGKGMRPGAPLAAARRKPQGWLKRLVDIAGAGFGLVLLAPLLIGIAAAIKLTSPGPVFFRQSRYGLNGMRFTIFKFRTMHVDQCDAAGVKQACANDPRITGIGKFLRRSNFDELPQLLNVLKGDMSLVGPRPHVPGMYAAGVPYEEFDKRYMERHQVRPGITGLAQVNGFRGETRDEHAARMRLEHDLDYIEKQSVQLDLKIIASTIVREFFKGNGY